MSTGPATQCLLTSVMRASQGVIESVSGDQIEVMLAQPWTDEHGNPNHTMMLSPGQIEPLPDAAELTQ
jgi:hypothetical protein